jgi:rod shape determining protein RodA
MALIYRAGARNRRVGRQPSRSGNSGVLGFLAGYDWLLIAPALALSVLGAFLVWSASRSALIDQGDDPQYYFRRHLLNLAIALVIGFAISRISHQTLKSLAIYFYAIGIVGLVAVLIPGVGTTVNGAQAWLRLPAGFSFQPSEFAKLGLIVLLAMLLSERLDNETTPQSRLVVLGLAATALQLGLILLEPDLGTAVITACISIAVIAVAGVKARWVVGLVAIGLSAGAAAVIFGFVSTYQVDRLAAFADPSLDPSGAGYNTQQARIAIGSGGLSGQGLFQGTQTAGQFVPEQQTDFVFTVAGEELGFIGSAAIVVLIGMVLWRGLHIASRATDLYGRLLAAGVVAWFAFQSFQNIGMNIGIMPVTGVPLPFVSYGGSSLFAAWFAIGLLSTVSRETSQTRP